MLTDYPSPAVLQNIRKNVDENLVSAFQQQKVKVRPHEWGNVWSADWAGEKHKYQRVLCADCLWMEDQHTNLLLSMDHFISPDGKVFVLAGFHTGRATVAAFFEAVGKAGLEVEWIRERSVQGVERAWTPGKDKLQTNEEELKKWMVIAVLKRGKPMNIRLEEAQLQNACIT